VGTRCNGDVFLGDLAMTLLDLNQMFSTDDRCRELLERLRWPEGLMCPRCKDARVSRMKEWARFECVGCEYQFTVTSGTIFHDSHLPLPVWFLATLLLCEAKKGISALQLKRTIWGEHKGSYKTAWYLCHRIRAAMATAEKTMLDGTIEMDETYIGGKRKGQGQRLGKEAKEIVVGIKQRDGDLRFFHAEDAKSGTLARYIKENVSTDVEVLITDTFPAYKNAVGNAVHKMVNHKANEYARYEDGACITTNGIESAFSLLKRGIVGSWHKVSAKHLPAYLEEMTFRFNRRGRSDLFVDTLRHMVTADPLTFEKLTA
jgi:transposase-like protein